jgi:putative heme-binding domain-containing protein
MLQRASINTMRYFAFYYLLSTVLVATMLGQNHEHGGSTATPSARKVEPPKVFLDKSPRIVAYQLKRLDNQRLLMVERKTDDAKYVPVYQAILARVGMSPQFRLESLEALAQLQDSDPVTIVMETINKLDASKREEKRTAKQLATILFGLKSEQLRVKTNVLLDAAQADDELTSSIAVAALLISGQSQQDLDKLTVDQSGQLAFLDAIPMLPETAQRAAFRSRVVRLLETSKNDRLSNAAIRTLGFVPNEVTDTFSRLVPLLANDKIRASTVRTLLTVPLKERAADASLNATNFLVDLAENTPAKDRTTAAFIDAMQLADQLLAIVPSEQARSFRKRLNAVTVRVVRIKTVEEEMRYDIPYFAVEAGKSVQIVLENHDLMPHNLVITVPEALKEVAQLGLQVGPNNGWQSLPYVPESDKVLHATSMVPADQQATLTFTAPTTAGEYPYVCTFPQHWYRMYGVMVVVNDLDDWLKKPVEPANPIGSNRSFVQAWKVSDLKDELESGIRGRSPEIGKRLFVEASCAGCHKMQGEGGAIGPELTDVFTRWKGDRVGILREVLEPSHKVDAKYVMQRILTVDGRTVTGVLLSEDDDKVVLLSNPEAKEPTVILQDDIEAMVPSSVSMMPKALMDQYTKDEVFEVLAYLESVASKPSP